MSRIPGFIGLAKIKRARAELGRLEENGGSTSPAHLPDTLSVEEIPSVEVLGTEDRVLARVDQDGFKFAAHPLDVGLFNRREAMLPRVRYRLDVVLQGGKVCFRKIFAGHPFYASSKYKVYSWLGMGFYTEAAALTRLKGLACVPQIHGVLRRERTLIMDYVHGNTILHLLSEHAGAVLDIELSDRSRHNDPEREEREIEAFARVARNRYQGDLQDMSDALFSRGVCPLDIKAGNLIIGQKTGKLYWVDFESASLNTFPRYQEDVASSRALLKRCFGVEAP